MKRTKIKKYEAGREDLKREILDEVSSECEKRGFSFSLIDRKSEWGEKKEDRLHVRIDLKRPSKTCPVVTVRFEDDAENDRGTWSSSRSDSGMPSCTLLAVRDVNHDTLIKRQTFRPGKPKKVNAKKVAEGIVRRAIAIGENEECRTRIEEAKREREDAAGEIMQVMKKAAGKLTPVAEVTMTKRGVFDFSIVAEDVEQARRLAKAVGWVLSGRRIIPDNWQPSDDE